MSANPIPRISETEWEVMRAVWAGHPATASEIIERLAAADPSWHPKTAKTLLARLVRKAALDYEAQGRRYVYEPLVTERECVAAASASFLERVFGGALKPMLAHFVESRRLSRAELAELRQLLERETPESNRRKS
ncbi:MAG TPA: BlaI/MecI/CopY family transcriptional regulator [Verrucomicrobiota bacterium]|nr:BlaI/MecI/CopY family transcriptional regulator [Verrucomicrobiota bacterium]HNT14925.1 BlaI/MecI/CopY family transcriptional regulator [Verrucomicrobiota bacterium]